MLRRLVRHRVRRHPNFDLKTDRIPRRFGYCRLRRFPTPGLRDLRLNPVSLLPYVGWLRTRTNLISIRVSPVGTDSPDSMFFERSPSSSWLFTTAAFSGSAYPAASIDSVGSESTCSLS